MLTDTKGVIPLDPTRRMLLKTVFLTTGAALVTSVIPLTVASETVSTTPHTTATVMVDGWLLRADDR